MKLSANYTYVRGWDVEEFEIAGETHARAVKDGTTIAIHGTATELIKLLDTIDNADKIGYDN